MGDTGVKSLWILAALSLAVLSQAAAAQAATTISVTPSPANTVLGGTLALSVDVSTDQSVYAVQFDVFFDKTRLTATGIGEGGFLRQGGVSTYCAVLSMDNTTGRVSYACTRFGTQSGATGSGSLLAMNFNAIAAGTAPIGLNDITLVDPSLQPMAFSPFNGTAVINRPPYASSLLITPAAPVKANNLVASYAYSDPDGNPESGTQIRWYKEGVLQAAFNDLNTVPSAAIAKGQRWYFTVRPKDGKDFGTLATSANATIGNTPPTAPSVNITPQNPTKSDTLTCIPTGSTDIDNDTITYSYKWYKNSVLQPGLTNNTVAPALLSRGDRWKCNATPNDGAANGPSGEFEVTLANQIPRILSFTPASASLKLREGISLLFNHTSSDADNDPLTYSWKLDGVQKAATQSWTFAPTAADCGATRNILLNITDGIAYASQSWSAAVRLRGDVDGNRKADIFDLAATGIAYGATPASPNWNANADLNPQPGTDGTPEGDGQIDIFDLATVGLNYRRVC